MRSVWKRLLRSLSCRGSCSQYSVGEDLPREQNEPSFVAVITTLLARTSNGVCANIGECYA